MPGLIIAYTEFTEGVMRPVFEDLAAHWLILENEPDLAIILPAGSLTSTPN